MCPRDGTADDAVLPTVPPVDLVGEEDAPCERRREPVGETEVGVGLRQRGRDPAQARGEHHRAGDEAARAEHDRGPPPTEDAQGRRTALSTALTSARASSSPGRRGKPEMRNVSSSKPASGTSRDSTRSGLPANVTVTPRSRSTSATASAGRT